MGTISLWWHMQNRPESLTFTMFYVIDSYDAIEGTANFLVALDPAPDEINSEADRPPRKRCACTASVCKHLVAEARVGMEIARRRQGELGTLLDF